MCSYHSSSSISNPFFFDFPTAAGVPISDRRDDDHLLEKGAIPNVGTVSAEAAGAITGTKGETTEEEEDRVGEGKGGGERVGGGKGRGERVGGGKGRGERVGGGKGGGTTTADEAETKFESEEQNQKVWLQQCCVVNPFRCEFESKFKQSSFFPMSVVCHENAFYSTFGTDSSSAGVQLLMDSGYRSTTSNSALEEEMAVAKRQRQQAERERRRAESKRKNHCKIPLSIPETINADNSMSNLLRRTCSTAVNGLSSLKVANWADGLPTARNAGGVKDQRRTKSVGIDRIPTANLYGTGWMVEADLSSSDDSPEGMGKGPMGVGDGGGSVEVGDSRVSIQLLQQLLSSRFCFISGLKTDTGHPMMVFPDSGSSLRFNDYQLLVDYLIHLNRIESISPVVEQRCPIKSSLLFNDGGFVLVVDRRMDKWSSVRNLFSYLMCYFPEPVCLVFLLKPEGVLQRAIEYAYRGLLDSNDKFKVVICQNCEELHEYVGPSSLTMDVGGKIRHDHSEWAAHRVDIERMKNSARIIAESLSEFGKCLRETELPNDVQTTERILKLQQQERDAIKEDFRISIRKGMALLRQVRHTEQSDQLSPSRLQNVTAIERMINQLQDTEQSFDTFWQKHRQRLHGCLELRQFEDEFRKLQNQFAKHMLHIEEHRQLGDSETVADGLAREHAEYGAEALNDVIRPCRALRRRGIELSAKGGDLSELLNCTKGSDSVGPKCDELNRMAEVLGGALERRGQMLEMSRKMHAQIAKANNWCRQGVELLSIAPLDLLSAGCSNNLAIYEHATTQLEQFIMEGDALKVDVLNTASSCFPSANSSSVDRPMLNSSAETCSLLTQVTERIDDIRRLSRARHEALKRLGEEKGRQRDGARPVQVVSPEKTQKRQQNDGNDKVEELKLKGNWQKKREK